VPRVGEVWLGTPEVAAPYVQAFRDGLRSQGFVDGASVTVVPRFANADPARLPALVADLVAMKVDVLVVTPKAFAQAMAATTTIPIVSMGFADPVAEGIVKNLAKPGGNVTGVSWQSKDTAGKRLQLAQQVVPSLRRAAVLFDPQDGRSVDAQALFDAARPLGIATRGFELRRAVDAPAVLRAVASYKPDVLLVTVNPTTLMVRDALREFGLGQRIPLISEGRVMAAAGVLLTYGPNELDIMRRAAVYVGRILRGAKPSELPIEQPMKLDLIVNLRTARAMDISVPDAILAQADEVLR
jgi:putative ABC transport system substrate-binding protein